MPVSEEVFADMAKACRMRAEERDQARDRLMVEEMLDYDRRCDIARLLGIQLFDGLPPEWDALMIRLRECLTTLRQRPLLRMIP